MTRTIHEIAAEIEKDWGTKVYFGARVYLSAMRTLNSIHDKFGADSAHSIVLYFLSNANTWRGKTARRIKRELQSILAAKDTQC